MESEGSEEKIDGSDEFAKLSRLTLAELEGIRLVLRGGSVIDWHRLNFRTSTEIDNLIRAHELDMNEPADRARTEAVKNAAVSYLRRKFDFPVQIGRAHV